MSNRGFFMSSNDNHRNEKLEELANRLDLVRGSLKGLSGILSAQSESETLVINTDDFHGLADLLKVFSLEISQIETCLRKSL